MREDQQRFPVSRNKLVLFINDLPHRQDYIFILNKQTSPIIQCSRASAAFTMLMSDSRRDTYISSPFLFSSLLFSSLLFSSLLFSSLLFSSLLFSSLLYLALEGCEDERSGLETSRKLFSSRSTALSREGVKSPLVRGLSAPLASPLVRGLSAPLASPLVLGLSAPLASPLVLGLSAPLASPLVRGLSAPLASPPAHGHHDFTSTLRSSCPCLSVFMLDSVKSAGLGHLLILCYFVSFSFLSMLKEKIIRQEKDW